MATGHVDRAVLAAHHKVVDVSEREGHGGDGHGLGLLERQLHAVLRGDGRGGVSGTASANVRSVPDASYKNHLAGY